jgi:uncharacterized protein
MAASEPPPPHALRPRVVLDTNTVLDWLLFADPGVAPLVAAIESGQLSWIASPRMREELARTMGYTSLAQWKPDSERTLTSFDRWAQLQAEPLRLPAGPRCTDPADQVFIDLALAHQARWLVTKDRALLKLARRAKALGLVIVRPQAWAGP